MKKRIYATVVVGALVLAQAVTVFANRPAHVALDGFLQDLSYEAFVVEGRTMIDARDAAEIFGDAVGNIEVVEIGGRDMLSIRDVANAMSLGINWDDENSLVRLSSANLDYSLLLLEPGAQPTFTLTYQEALSRVNNRDTRLISMEENVIILDRELREIEDDLRDENIHGRRRAYTTAEVQILRAREAVRNQQSTLEINERMIRSGNELQLRNALADIARDELDIVLLERQLSVEERNMTIVELMHDLGMESDTGLRDARASLERTQTNLESLHSSLNSSRVALNTLLGLPAGTVVDVQAFSWIAPSSPLQGNISTHRANAPNVALLQLDLDFAEYVFFSYDALLLRNEQESDYRYRGRRQDASIVIEMRNDINAAERAISDARDSLESRIRSLHNDIEALREQMTISQNDLANAIEDYQEAALRYMTGMGTWLELERAMLAILSHEVALARHEINLGMLIMMYNRPYLG